MVIELPPNLPVGVRFHPTDQELITHYLRPKILGHHFDDAIAEIDFCNWEPWELPHKSKIKSNDRMWWFMCRLEYKHSNGRRSKRTTKTGFWKVTGQERTVKDQDSKACIGKKRTLVFHSGPTPGKRTNWVMQEYYLDPELVLPHMRTSYVICRLKKKTDEKVDTPDGNRGEPSGMIVADLEIPGPYAAVQGLHAQTEANPESDPRYGDSYVTDINEIHPMLSEDITIGDDSPMLNNESEELPDEFVGLSDDPYEICPSEMASNFIRFSTLLSSLTDALTGSDMDTEEPRVMRGESQGYDPRKVQRMQMENAPTEPQRNKSPSAETNVSFPKQVDVRGGGGQKRIRIQKNSPSAATSSNKGKEASRHVGTTVDLPKGVMIGESRNGRKAFESSNLEEHMMDAAFESVARTQRRLATFLKTSSLSRRISCPLLELWSNSIIAILCVLFLFSMCWKQMMHNSQHLGDHKLHQM